MRLWIIGLLVSVLWSPVLAQGAYQIDDVKVLGNRRSEIEAVLRVVQTKAKTPLNRRQISDDIKRIFALGLYRDIQVDLTIVDGKRILTFLVQEKPSVRKVIIDGNDELSEDDIKEVVDIQPFGILDRTKVTQNTEKIKDLYIEKGFFLADVKAELKELPNNEVDITFRVNEADKVLVKRIELVGNKVLTDSFIKERIETRESGAFSSITSSGTYNKDAFERDMMRISQFYWDEGYVKVRVGTPAIELSPDRSQIYITVSVDEGDRFQTGPVDIMGDFLADAPKDVLMKRVRLREGDWFSSTKLKETINAIGEVYKDQGYAYVNLVPNTSVSETKKQVSLNIEIDKGPKIRIGRIRIVGNQKTRDKVIRREMRIYEGEYFSSTGLKRSERLINRLGFFEPGGVRIRTVRGVAKDTMDVVVEVKQKSTGPFQVGAGFSTLENFVAQAQIAQNNLFGRGQSLSLQATLSSIRSIANIRFADDYFLDSRVRFATNLYRFESTFENFTRTSLGGDVMLGYPINDDWSFSGTYKLEKAGAEVGGFGNDAASRNLVNLYGSGITSSLRLTLFYDTRNNRLFPTDGLFTSASVEHANEYLLSENLFTRYKFRNRYYRNVFFGLVAKLNTQWGLITSPTAQGVPIFERFFVGGPLSVRGFRRQTLGPEIGIISSGLPFGRTAANNIGGTEELIFNLELEYPIFQKVGIRGVFFMDAGNAFEYTDPWNDKIDAMRYSWGFGIRWFSPIGPLRFEWGFPFEPQAGEESSVFDFSIGNFF
ncbi:MAG: outer membrane protein assembly factor BamA [Myxococcota bacterium]|nr:outer membrane protein assembly factor BamA [Myxococcota bacterium]